jgi:hypothetical protein
LTCTQSKIQSKTVENRTAAMNLMKGSFKIRAQIKLWGHIVALFLATSVTAIAGARMLVTNSQMSAAPASVTGNGGRRSMSGQVALSMVCDLHPHFPAAAVFFFFFLLYKHFTNVSHAGSQESHLHHLPTSSRAYPLPQRETPSQYDPQLH